MGFTTGFTGGVTLVLGAAYLTLQAHQRNRQRQAETLRAQTYVLQSLSYVPASAPPPRTIAEELARLEHQQELLSRARQQRRRRAGRLAGGGDSGDDGDGYGGDGDVGGFLERAKARWNAEVEGAVRWAATKDWVAAREDAEAVAAMVWARVTGSEPPAGRARVDAVADKVSSAAAAARGSVGQATARTREAAQTKTEEAREAATSIWGRGLRKSKEVAAKAKAAVGLAEDKAEQKAAELAGAVSDVEKVLQQRYERKSGEELERSPEEVLAERYKPVEQQDNSKLRGL